MSNDWAFYAATVNELGHMKIYKDGILIVENPNGNPIKTIMRSNQFIGKSVYPSDQYFKGAIDDLKMYSGVLSDEQILNNFRITSTLSLSDFNFKNQDFFSDGKAVYVNKNALSSIENILIFNGLGQKIFYNSQVKEINQLPKLNSGMYILKVGYKNGHQGTKKYWFN